VKEEEEEEETMGGYLCWLDCEHTYDFSYFFSSSFKGTARRKKKVEKRGSSRADVHTRGYFTKCPAKEQKQQFSMSRRGQKLFFFSFSFSPCTNEGCCRVKKRTRRQQLEEEE
jgi:hypothetical protein